MNLKRGRTGFGESLKAARTGQAVSQVDLAARIGISNKTLYNIEAGKCWPSMPVYRSICRELKLAVPPLFLD